MKVKVLKMYPEVKLPAYATVGAACMDVFAPEDITLALPKNNTVVIQTGLKFEVPQGYSMFIYSRSGHGFKYDVCLANGTGVIDSDYRGEVGVKLIMHGVKPLHIKKGDAIAQFVVLPIEQVSLEVVTELSDTVRAEGGFGSTDKAAEPRKYFGKPAL